MHYLQFVTDHHAMGVMMAEMCAEKAVSPELRALCERVAVGQAMENEQVLSWLKDWNGIEFERDVSGTGRMNPRAARRAGVRRRVLRDVHQAPPPDHPGQRAGMDVLYHEEAAVVRQRRRRRKASITGGPPVMLTPPPSPPRRRLVQKVTAATARTLARARAAVVTIH